jgi:hypothetical protein
MWAIVLAFSQNAYGSGFSSTIIQLVVKSWYAFGHLVSIIFIGCCVLFVCGLFDLRLYIGAFVFCLYSVFTIFVFNLQTSAF